MPEKIEGAKIECLSCGVTLTCRKKTYAAFKDKPEREVLQWQHEEGKAHYKWVGEGKYDCVGGVGNTTETVDVVSGSDSLNALNLKVDKIYAMMSEQYEFWKASQQ